MGSVSLSATLGNSDVNNSKSMSSGEIDASVIGESEDAISVSSGFRQHSQG
jgi:hypothetical protein